MATSIFAGLANAVITESGSYLNPNFKYKLEILKCQVVTPRQGPSAFVVDFKVLESNDPDIKVGETRNWYQKQNDSFLGAVLEFMLAALGFNMNDPAHKAHAEKEVQPRCPEFAEAACGTDQILKGKLISVDTRSKGTKAGGDFTKHTWHPAAA
jgi:hypothetical protein